MKQQTKPFFPLFVDLSGTKILVVGGGAVALRKTRTLQRFCRNITVVAPEILPEFTEFGHEDGIQIHFHRRPYREEDLTGVRIAVIATDDSRLNEQIAGQCRARGILRNTASDRNLCDFYFPSVIERDGVVIGIGSGGDPARTKQVREHLEAALADPE